MQEKPYLLVTKKADRWLTITKPVPRETAEEIAGRMAGTNWADGSPFELGKDSDIVAACPDCGGHGKVDGRTCPFCHGYGWVPDDGWQEKEYEVTVVQTITKTYAVFAVTADEAREEFDRLSEDDDELQDSGTSWDMSDEVIRSVKVKRDTVVNVHCSQCDNPIPTNLELWFNGPDPDGDRIPICHRCAQEAGLIGRPDQPDD